MLGLPPLAGRERRAPGGGALAAPWTSVRPQPGQKSVPSGATVPHPSQRGTGRTNYIPYFTRSTALSRRLVGLVTADPVLYADLAEFLRERKLPCMSLIPGERIPDRVVVILTSPQEAERLAHPRVIAVAEHSDRRALTAAIESALSGQSDATELCVGLDPGPRPGYAVVSGSRLLAQGVVDTPEEVAEFGRNLHRRFPGRAIRFRVGSGDPPRRHRILLALQPLRRPVEVVDETGTTPRGRRPRDASAARAIAMMPGRPAAGQTTAPITEGEVANVQRLSREGSGGRFTITRAQARRVVAGELTLGQALDAHHRTRGTVSGRQPS